MMLTDQELQSLRNLGNQCEEAASEIYSLRAALTQKRAEYEDLKQTMHNMARNHALQLEAARKHEPESVPELRAQLQTLGLWIAEALPTLDTVEPECSTEADLLTALIRRGEMLVLASLARGGALGPNVGGEAGPTAVPTCKKR